jgi:hypothetical protein
MNAVYVLLLFGAVVMLTHFLDGITGFGATVLALPFCTMLVGHPDRRAGAYGLFMDTVDVYRHNRPQAHRMARIFQDYGAGHTRSAGGHAAFQQAARARA